MGEWSNLTQREKSNIIRFAIKNGVSDINTIRDTFNVYAKDSLANVDYNMAAAKASGFGSNGNGHYPDTFKKPNHPTFSEESIYHSEATPGGRWRGNTYEPSDFVLNQQGGWNNFLKGFYGQEQGTGAVPIFNGGVMLPEIEVRPSPKYKKSSEAYYDPETDTVFAPDSTGEFYTHERFHARPNMEYLQKIAPYYENLNDSVLTSMGADLPFINRNGDPGQYYSPEEIGARVAASLEMLKKAGVSKIDSDFVKESRKNETKYGDNYRDLLHMYNDGIITNLLSSYANGGRINIAPSKRGTFTAAATKHGKSVQAFASQVLANKENYSPAMVKKAVFAHNSKSWKHDEGGYLGREFENGGKKKIADSPLYKQSAKIMEGVRRIRNYENLTGYNQADLGDYWEQFMLGYRGDPYAIITPSGTPQDTYLLPAKMFDKALLEAGYTHGQSKDYGTVNRAATNLGQRLNRDISVYQAYPDAINKDSLIHLGSDVELIGALYHTYPGQIINPVILEHAGDYASAYYMNPITGQLYLKGWDLNDYSPASQGHNSYNNTLTALSVILDKIGNPAVYTTGFQPAKVGGQAIFMEGAYPNPDTHQQAYIDKNLSYKEQMRAFNMAIDAEIRRDAINEVLTPLMKKKGLYKHVVDGQYFFSPLEEEVVVTPNKKSTGGPLYPFSFQKNPYWKTPVVRYDEGGVLGHQYGLGDFLRNLFKRNVEPQVEETSQTPAPLDHSELRRRQAYAESRFNNNAKSEAGAVGMFQIMPSTLVDYNKANGTSYTTKDLSDQSINTAVRDWYIDKLSGRPWVTKGGASDSIQFGKVLAGYNYGGQNTLDALNKAKADGVDIYNSWDWLNYMPKETQDYINFILRNQDNSILRNDSAYKAASLLNKDKVELLR